MGRIDGGERWEGEREGERGRVSRTDLQPSELQKVFQSRQDRQRLSESVQSSQAKNPRKKGERVKRDAYTLVLPTTDARDDEFTQSLPVHTSTKKQYNSYYVADYSPRQVYTSISSV